MERNEWEFSLSPLSNVISFLISSHFFFLPTFILDFSCFLTLLCIKLVRATTLLSNHRVTLCYRICFSSLMSKGRTRGANEGLLLQDTFKNAYEWEELFTLIILRCKCSCFKEGKNNSEENATVKHENGSLVKPCFSSITGRGAWEHPLPWREPRLLSKAMGICDYLPPLWFCWSPCKSILELQAGYVLTQGIILLKQQSKMCMWYCHHDQTLCAPFPRAMKENSPHQESTASWVPHATWLLLS